jgi:hypothetical protein
VNQRPKRCHTVSSRPQRGITVNSCLQRDNIVNPRPQRGNSVIPRPQPGNTVNLRPLGFQAGNPRPQRGHTMKTRPQGFQRLFATGSPIGYSKIEGDVENQCPVHPPPSCVSLKCHGRWLFVSGPSHKDVSINRSCPFSAAPVRFFLN